MSDMKSKLPDFKELASMTGKLFGDIKTSVGQIIQDYKENRAHQATKDEPTVTEVKPKTETVVPPPSEEKTPKE